jgi:hypothetical protein
MRRSDIPARLRVARAADIAKIPDAALKAMAPADVAPRLLAADEYRRRARVRGLDGDLYRHRLGLAREVLETADQGRAAELVKAAGVLAYTLRDGTKVPTSEAAELKTAIGLGKRDHRTGRPGDDPAFRRHLIDRAKALNLRQEIPASWGSEYAGKGTAAKAAQYDQRATAAQVSDPALARAYRRLAAMERAGTGRPAAPARAPRGAQVAKGTTPVVTLPALDDLTGKAAAAQSVSKAIEQMAAAGRLGALARDIAHLADHVKSGGAIVRNPAPARPELSGALAKAAHYERQAARVSSPVLASGYRELARGEREKAGTA